MPNRNLFKNEGPSSWKRPDIFSLILSATFFIVFGASDRSNALATHDASAPASTAPAAPVATVRPTTPTISLFDIFRQLQVMQVGEVIWVNGLDRNPLARALFDLVQYMRNNIQIKTPDEVMAAVPPFRRGDFGIWVNEDGPSNCYNTRAEVLIRDATVVSAVKFDAKNPCKIIRGEWADPYSGTDFKLASAVQVDHVVPLKNAYRSGAHTWGKERRCHFGNFLRDSNHLLAVSGHENMSKGDSGPERYLPPNIEYVCAYLANWIRIKAVWNLDFNRDESSAIENNLRAYGCLTKTTTLPLKEIVETRRQTLATNVKCVPSVPTIKTDVVTELPPSDLLP